MKTSIKQKIPSAKISMNNLPKKLVTTVARNYYSVSTSACVFARFTSCWLLIFSITELSDLNCYVKPLASSFMLLAIISIPSSISFFSSFKCRSRFSNDPPHDYSFSFLRSRSNSARPRKRLKSFIILTRLYLLIVLFTPSLSL